MKRNLRLSASLLCFLPTVVFACTPGITVLNGLTTQLAPIDTNQDGVTDQLGATIHVNDLILGTFNPCGEILYFGIERISESTRQIPEDTVLHFDQSELNIQEVRVWVRDRKGNSNYVDTYVLVQESRFRCQKAVPPLRTACKSDELPPVLKVLHGLTGIPSINRKGQNTVRVSAGAFISGKTDNCSVLLRTRIVRSEDSDGTPPRSAYLEISSDESGKLIPVEIWGSDPSGNWNYVESYFQVEHSQHKVFESTGCEPDPISPSGLIMHGLVKALPAGKALTVNAHEFVWRSSDRCSQYIEARISRKAEQLKRPPLNRTIQLSCSDVGVLPLTIWLMDETGNWSSADTYLLLQDNLGFCDGYAGERSGVVVWPEELYDMYGR